MARFSDQVKKFQRTFDKRIRATARSSVQEVVSLAQRDRDSGGQMRVVTGFLRASIQGATNTMPSGPSVNVGEKLYPAGTQVAGTPIVSVLLNWDPNMGMPLFIGWTANYARPREYHDGFLRLAVQKWDTIVIKEAKLARAGIG